MTEEPGDPLDSISESLSQDQIVKTSKDGTHRSVPPAVTVERVKRHMSSLGITRIADVTGLDRIGIPVVMVCRPNSRSIAVCQGKGIDLHAATASGLMEAVEIHHAETVELPLRLGSYSELSSRLPVIDIEAVPQIAGSIYNPDLAMLWIEGLDLVGKKRLWLPFELVRANYTLPIPPGSGCFDASTNGLASGNHLLEALCHGICEVIERDANALWSRPGLAAHKSTRIDLNEIAMPGCRQILDRLTAADFNIGVWETTSDTGVPSFYCVITDSLQRDAHIGVGSGCHPAREIALSRALTEAVQVRTTYISGARDDLMPDEYDSPVRTTRRRWADRLMQSAPTVSYNGGADHTADTLNEDLTWLLGRLLDVGISQVVAVNLTRPEFGLPVVKVVIPGLEGPSDHDGYVPGKRALRVGA